MADFTVLDYIALMWLLIGGLLLIRSGVKMLNEQDKQDNRDNLCPPHQWEGEPLRCKKCGRLPGKLASGRNWPPTFPAA